MRSAALLRRAFLAVVALGGSVPQVAWAQADETDEPEPVSSQLAAVDPMAVWPAPSAQSGRVGVEAYYYFARSDRRSLLEVPTADNPLHVYIGGDSLVGGAVFGMMTLSGDDPRFVITEDIRKSTGNVSPWYFDWPEYMTNEVSAAGYDVIVLSIGGNDNQRFRSNLEHEAGSDGWKELYRDSVRALLRAADRPGRLLVWVGIPHLRPPGLRNFAALANPLVAEVVAEFERATFVDAAAIVSPEGKFTRSLHGRHVRTADGVHYTYYGGELVSQPVLDEIDRRAGVPVDGDRAGDGADADQQAPASEGVASEGAAS